MILLDLSHTSHTRARTGIQKVCRSLNRELSALGKAQAITWDPHAAVWRKLESWEKGNLDSEEAGGGSRGARWPLHAQLRGKLRRLLGARSRIPRETSLIVPELFSVRTATALPALLATVKGPRVALFHDAIALKYPELSPSSTVARFPSYLRELSLFDGIAAVSEDSRQSILGFWDWAGITRRPSVVTIPLGVDAARPGSETPDDKAPPLVLSVGSLEGRKNHVSLLQACEKLWARGLQFHLHLIGLARKETAAGALELVEKLRVAGRPIRFDGPSDEDGLAAAYRACRFSVYPSLVEGFGLPVLESLSYGKPCICSGHGALGESARGGGCLMLDTMDPESIASAMERLLSEKKDLRLLSQEAVQRRIRSWSDYTRDLVGWMETVKPRG